MKWATRPNCHVDRAACAWLIGRFLDPNPEFLFITDLDDAPGDATPFDIGGAQLSHHNGRCSFETFLEHFELDDPVLWDLARIVHVADLDDDRFDAPEAAGLDAVVRGLSLVTTDEQLLELSATLYDGLYEHRRQALLSVRGARP